MFRGHSLRPFSLVQRKAWLDKVAVSMADNKIQCEVRPKPEQEEIKGKGMIAESLIIIYSYSASIYLSTSYKAIFYYFSNLPKYRWPVHNDTCRYKVM